MAESAQNRKDLIRGYKEKKKEAGIFAIRNNITGKVFLDRSLNLDVAFNKHRFELNYGSHRNKDLQKDWNQYGEKSFSYEVIERLEDVSDDAKDINEDLAELKELCRERIAGAPEMKGFY